MFSVRDSVWDSVRDSVRASVWTSIRDSVWDSLEASVCGSVRASVRASVGASVGVSIWASIWDSVWAHISSIFPNVKKWRYIEHKGSINPFQSGIDLWKAGLVPSYANGIWRLHAGTDAKVVYKKRSKK